MVEISPFKGIIYNKKKIDNLDDVMSPPYDIISPEMQETLYEKHPNNFVRLILGRQFPDDTDANNRYTRARDFFISWLKEEILQKSDEDAVYPYKIEYKILSQHRIMNGFFALLKIDPEYKFVKAHERTLSKPKTDRLNLMRQCKSNFEPIQLLYIDERDEIRKRIDEVIDSPIISIKGYDGFRHKLWQIKDEKTISVIRNQLRNKILFIADGHHRYQTAINYANEIRKKTGNNDPDAPFNYRLVVLVNMFDEGLLILPTHRLIKKSDVDLEKLSKDLEKFFVIEKKIVKTSDRSKIINEIKIKLKTKNEHKFVIYSKGCYWVLTLKDEKIMDNFARDHSKTWRTLDVSILHRIVLEHFMGIDEKNLENHVKYTRDDEEAICFVDENKFDFSILMNATKMKELKAVADAGEHMPQKSTYFLPKMLSGLVIYKMDI